MKDLPNVEALRTDQLLPELEAKGFYPAAEMKAATAAEARDKFLAYIMCKPEVERDLILYTADKLLDAVCSTRHMLNAFALANAELAALHEAGLLESRVIVPE